MLVAQAATDLDRSLQERLAEASLGADASHMQQYTTYCALCDRLWRPRVPSAEVLAIMVVGRARPGYAISSVELGVAYVSRWAGEQGVARLSGQPLVLRALQVAARLAVPRQRHKLPLDRQDLERVVLQALRERDSFVAVRDVALCLVGWAGMFRCSELVGLRWRDVVFVRGDLGLVVYVSRSEADQAGEGAWVFVAACSEHPHRCPVLARRRLQLLGEGAGWVFRARGRGPRAPWLCACEKPWSARGCSTGGCTRRTRCGAAGLAGQRSAACRRA